MQTAKHTYDHVQRALRYDATVNPAGTFVALLRQSAKEAQLSLGHPGNGTPKDPELAPSLPGTTEDILGPCPDFEFLEGP